MVSYLSLIESSVSFSKFSISFFISSSINSLTCVLNNTLIKFNCRFLLKFKKLIFLILSIYTLIWNFIIVILLNKSNNSNF